MRRNLSQFEEETEIENKNMNNKQQVKLAGAEADRGSPSPISKFW